MLYWYPLTMGLDIPQPKTNIVLQKDVKGWFKILDNGLDDEDKAVLEQSATQIGYPLFIRTDYSSAKHDFKDTCFVAGKSTLYQNLHNLFESNYCHNLYPEAIILREYLTLDWSFKAFACMPVAPERRYFISDGEVVCHHPYWVEDSIQFYCKNYVPPYDWKDKLRNMNTESISEIALLKGYAEKIASVLEGEFSVDFAKGRNEQWYFIDAASAIQSWHPNETENSSFDAHDIITSV